MIGWMQRRAYRRTMQEQLYDYEMAVDYLRAVGFGIDAIDSDGATLSISPQPQHPSGPTMTIHVTKRGARWKIVRGGQGEGIGRDTLMDKLDSMGVRPESKRPSVVRVERGARADHVFNAIGLLKGLKRLSPGTSRQIDPIIGLLESGNVDQAIRELQTFGATSSSDSNFQAAISGVIDELGGTATFDVSFAAPTRRI